MAEHGPDGQAVSERAPRGGVEGLIGRLLRDLASTGVMPSEDGAVGVEEVFLDVEVDGVRCLLIRRIPEPNRPAAYSLSPREREIARMVAKGYANKTIASVLDISSWTVSSHLRRIYSKLGVCSRAAMVARLLEGQRSDPMPQNSKPLSAVHNLEPSSLPLLEQIPATRA
jgi:DNA-binding CsgD family transcriptional regulator